MATQTLKIALLGAESTGKTQLAQDLAAHWSGNGQRVLVVAEYLREWCEREGRTPNQNEQLAIAREQARRVDEAAACDVLIADTTALMVAVYSDFVFADTTLYPLALAHQRRFDSTLLTGLDLPWVFDGLQREGPQVRQPIDALLRQALQQAQRPFQVVYGSGSERLDHALAAIASILPKGGRKNLSGPNPLSSVSNEPLSWLCERCSQADCEHRLFSALLGKT